MQVYRNKSTFFVLLLWDTNVADVLLFLGINKAGVERGIFLSEMGA